MVDSRYSVCGDGSTVRVTNDRVFSCCINGKVENKLDRGRKAGLLRKDGLNKKDMTGMSQTRC